MADHDALFGIHAAAMQFQSRRMDLIAGNIANADTPGYKARDLDFAQAMEQAGQQPTTAAVSATNPAHMPVADVAGSITPPDLVYRSPQQPSQDGNTVDMHTEQAAFADAALHYKASMSFVDAKLKSIMTALTGQ